eukprot:g490.t1
MPAPNSYKVEQALRPRVQPNYVPFSSQSKRPSIVDKRDTPAPGAYEVVSEQESIHTRRARVSAGFSSTNRVTTSGAAKDAPANGKTSDAFSVGVFRSNAPRFAPSAPGSTAFAESTVAENPGPGAYSLAGIGSKSLSNLHKLKGATSKGAGASLGGRYTPVPTIPRPQQAHGYEQSVNGKLLLQHPSGDVYSGLGYDTVGPAKYDLKHGSAKMAGVSMKRSSSRKPIWGKPRTKVGPGDYDLLRSQAGARNMEASMLRESPAFASRVPMAHQIPDDHDDSAHLQQRQTASAGAENLNLNPGSAPLESSLSRASLAKSGSNVQRFGSTAKREGWDRHPDAPYTSKQAATPGPGMYGERRTIFKTKVRRTLTDEVVGFNSTDPRPCLKPTDVRYGQDAVGPGAYNNPIHIKPKKRISRRGVFGSTTDRNKGGAFSAPGPQRKAPGPGSYDLETKNEGRPWRTKSKSTASFASRTKRFQDGSKTSSQPQLGIYMTAPSWGKRSSRRHSSGSFASTADRFGSKAEQARNWGITQGPGPGEHSTASMGATAQVGIAQRRRMQQKRMYMPGNSLQPRFQRASKGRVKLGPGSYNVSGSMTKRSFNVTYR